MKTESTEMWFTEGWWVNSLTQNTEVEFSVTQITPVTKTNHTNVNILDAF